MGLKIRDYGLDTAKGVLIILVILGHLFGHLIKFTNFTSHFEIIIDYFLYYTCTFHMPAFIFISGYFSKALIHKKRAMPLVQDLLVPFLFFHSLGWLISSRQLSTFFYPQETLWYLLCLFFWRLLIICCDFIHKSETAILISSLICCLLTGFLPTINLFSLTRAINFFPYFIVGLFTNEKTIGRIREHKNICLFITVISVLTIALIKQNNISRNVFLMNTPYSNMFGLSFYSIVFSLFLRLISLLVGVMLAICLISFIPNRKNVITTLGVNCITVYLAHSFIVRLLRNVITITFKNETIFTVMIIGLTLLICLLFGNNYVKKWYRVFFVKLVGVIKQKYGGAPISVKNIRH